MESEVGEGGGRREVQPRIRVRIESLSDMVFGLALSIGSVFLLGKQPQGGQDILNSVLLFGFGFLIIVMTWVGYSRTMAVLPVEAPLALYTNLALLFVVAIEPYLFYVLQSVGSLGLVDAASVAYSLDVGAMFLLQGGLASLVVQEAKSGLHGQRPLHPITLRRFKSAVRYEATIGGIFVASALPIFWVATPFGYLRFYLWFSSFAIFMVGRATTSRRQKG